MAASQFVFGQPFPVVAAVATAQAVTTGDLCAMSAGTIVRAEDISWNNDTLTTQEDFAAKFLGVAAQTKTANVARVYGNSDDNRIRIDCGGIWEFDCATANFNIGDKVGAAKASGNALESQKVVRVTAINAAVGVCVDKRDSVTRVRILLWTNLLPLSRTIY